MELNIENFIKEKGKRISDLIYEKYDWIPIINNKSFFWDILDWFLDWWYSLHKIEVEIFNRCLHESNVFFINNSELKFDNNVIKVLNHYLESRLKYSKEIKKMTTEIKLANVIKIKVIDFLFDRDFII